MTLKELQTGVLTYATENVFPEISGGTVNVFGFNVPISKELMQFGIGLGTGLSTFSLEKYAPALQMAGIIDETGQIDREKLLAQIEIQMDAIPEKQLKVGKLTFEQSDVGVLAKYI